ncbi:hypothetical protein AXG55_02925 [Silvanigrella aquatica]|uniref:Farnesyl-diphosphate farnesyltransferase n=2 Tax=Silvanigrella aquatica TaxID=1915309 RepID=A0A1L4D4B8_9BACT|nr:hypothetical protein AXG55_02925 [Silvanigrella aquatica]
MKYQHNNVQISYHESLNYCLSILPNVSRSFAIGIQFLSGELRKSVLVGYLLCRIIDTIEDDRYLDLNLKEQYLNRFLNCFDDIKETYTYSKVSSELQGDPYHLDLVKNTHRVFEVYTSLSKNTQNILKNWVSEMSKGMSLFVNRYPKGIRIVSLDEYKEYCYYVAGTVGYLLTDLWKEYGSFINENVYNKMQKNSVIFGEALQTVNILKDIKWDAQNENSIYIPLNILKKYGVNHESLLNISSQENAEKAVREILILAQQDLQISVDYLKSIPKMNFRIRFFCIFPLFLAFATLRELDKSRSILSSEKVIKVSRLEVKKIKKYSLFASLSNKYLDRAVTKILKF